MTTVPELLKRKLNGEKISMVTCYDYTSAKIVSKTNIDILLVGDTLSMTVHGYQNTIHATVEMMALHTQAVSNGAPNKFILGDMPFLSTRKGLKNTMTVIEKLMQAGATAIKLEGYDSSSDKLIRHIVNSGVPVMGHLGLTPQFVQQFGGFKVQGKDPQVAGKIIDSAKALQDLGCFATVLECIPATLAQTITASVTIPTIGIGAGPHCDGQVLVWQDMLGLDPDFQAKFVKQYASLYAPIHNALTSYDQEVKNGNFPENIHAYQ